MAFTAALAAAVPAPAGRMFAASAWLFLFKARSAAAAAKNASALGWSMPDLPERSLTVPRHAAMSAMTDFINASSPADSAMMTPSPLSVVLAKILFASEASASEIAEISFLPRLTRICFADGRERHAVAALHEVIRIFEQGAGPFDGGDDFRRANATVLVNVNQRGGFRIKFNPRRRTGERDP